MSIKRLDNNDTQKICASQVIVSLSDAVKELLENSLDAKSNQIEIKLKNFGADLIEIQDNGTGVEILDFSELMKSHSTSKISDFKDISALNTFGFRGEALNSLNSLGDLSIHTCSEFTTVGTLLSYNSAGDIITSNPLARSRGTTVTVKNIFNRLPVRRRQLLTNIRKEYDKMISNVTSYCLLAVGVKISCYRLEGGKQMIISNGSASSVRSNIEAVFGSNQMKALLDVVVEQNISQEILDEFSITDTEYIKQIRLQGCISRPVEGNGRSSSDRQFVFVNGRPCDSTKIAKVIINCYRDVNGPQQPVFILSLTLPRESIDVNVEPSKRTVFFDHMSDILALIKASIRGSFAMYGCSESSRSMDTSLQTAAILSFLGDHGSSPISSRQSPSSVVGQSKRSITTWQTSTPKKMKTDEVARVQRLGPSVKETPPRISKRHESLAQGNREIVKVHFSQKMLLNVSHDNQKKIDEVDGKYSAKLVPGEDGSAEEELRRIFKKTQFLELEALGQFNLGFIVARLGQDLFIVDQHASDERSRYEYLLDECKLGSQPLVKPVAVRLGSGAEQLLLDNLETFERCGFRFVVRESGLEMTAVCCRNGLVLGVQDVLEMIDVLRDTTITSILPSKIRTAVASNACRSAIMIGRCLSLEEMTEVIRTMATLKNPWVCAHGRPTMRHLCSLGILQ